MWHFADLGMTLVKLRTDSTPKQFLLMDDEDTHDTSQGEQIPEDRMYFNLTQWYSLMFLWCQARFNLTQTAAKFLLLLFVAVLTLISHPICCVFPSTTYRLNSFFMPMSKIEDYVLIVCLASKCNQVYRQDKLYSSVAMHVVNRKCSAVHFGKRCEDNLFCEKKLTNQRITLCPYKIYLFKAPSEWLAEIFQSPEFRKLLELRLNQKPPAG